ncbi:MAG: hypothetical protein KDB27_01970 [Planctomycetales bacterium]|nr:hypothetical protein [Planctomycetales bacterium]
MTDKRVTPTLIEQEHTEIEQITRTLYRELAERTVPRARVLDLLAMLYQRVAGHFEDELASGFLGRETQGNDELNQKRQTLCKDHQELLLRFDRVVRLAEEGTVQPEWWNELERQFHALSFEVINHENRKQALLDEAIVQANM